MRALLLLALAAAAPRPALAQVDVATAPAASLHRWYLGLNGSQGSEHYTSSTLWGKAKIKEEDWDGELSLKPSFNQYKSDVSSGTVRNTSIRAGWSQDAWDAGVTLGRSPVTNGYGNTVFGVDAGYGFPVGEETDELEPPRLDLGAGYTHTEHEEDFTGTVTRRTRAGTVRTVTVSGRAMLGQGDLYGSVAGTWYDAVLSLTLTGSSYDKDPDKVAAFASRRTALAGVATLVQGFPKSSSNLRLSYEGFDVVSPYVSYTHTTFALDQPDSEATTVGAYVTVTQAVELNASYEVYRQSGQPELDYAAGGVQVRF